jgi:tripartite-type tricarboxylate transporter receptor subunit TctC
MADSRSRGAPTMPLMTAGATATSPPARKRGGSHGARSALASSLTTPDSNAEPFMPLNSPVNPVRMLVPLPPRGGSDLVGRIVAAELTDDRNKPVVFDNRPGAGSAGGHIHRC